MIDGFWTVQFQGPQGRDGGVAVFSKGKSSEGIVGTPILELTKRIITKSKPGFQSRILSPACGM